MIRPLREEDEPGEGRRDAIALLRKVSRLEPTPAQKQRLWAALQQSQPPRRIAGLRWAPALVVLLMVAAASAMIGRSRSRVSPRVESAQPTAAQINREPSRAVTPAVATVAKQDPPAPSREPIRRRASSQSQAPAEPVASDPEAALVTAAMRALRVANDPGRAGVLLEDYLRLYPEGALTEEVLVLAIEAALARKDGEAAGWAKRYLAQFPNGRNREMARRVLGQKNR